MTVEPAEVVEEAPPASPTLGKDELDHAWKVLSIGNEWVRHAETKAGFILAAAGVAGGVLYNLVKNETAPTTWYSIIVVVCCGALTIGAISALLCLIPRLRLGRTEQATSLIYYLHIVRKFGAAAYVPALTKVIAEPGSLVMEIANQTYAISTVARRKYRWASVGTYCLAVGIVFLIFLAIVIGSRTLH